MNNIIVTGGSGRFGQILKNFGYKFKFPKKNELNIMSLKSIEKYFKKTKPKVILHLAGLSRPIVQHENDIVSSINLNIIGTSNVVMACKSTTLRLFIFLLAMFTLELKGNI